MQQSLTSTTQRTGWQAGLACAAVVGPMVEVPVDFAGSLSSSESFPLALAAWMFIGAAILIFQCWGKPAGYSAPVGPAAAEGVKAEATAGSGT